MEENNIALIACRTHTLNFVHVFTHDRSYNCLAMSFQSPSLKMKREEKHTKHTENLTEKKNVPTENANLARQNNNNFVLVKSNYSNVELITPTELLQSANCLTYKKYYWMESTSLLISFCFYSALLHTWKPLQWPILHMHR